MNKILAGTSVGRKNILFGIAQFLILGVIIGVPLTINMFGGSAMTRDQYQVWKVVHGYGVFLSFVNYFFGLIIDRLNLTESQKEISSWSFLIAGLVGGFGRMILVLIGALGNWGLYASLIESAGFILGTVIFVIGQLRNAD
jgi:hypothetical protein